MTELTTAQAMVATLEQYGIDTLFGVPGAQTYDLFDAIGSSSIRLIGARHEQATAYMAFGYAKSTGKVGVYSVVPGPGMLNATAALCTAYGAGAPVLCLTGQVPSEFIGSGKGALHELPDQLATLRSLTKWADRINHPEQAPALIAEAFRQMLSGRQQPVALETPWDVFGQRADVCLQPDRGEIVQPALDLNSIQAAVDLIKEARHPMIMVGGGAQGCSAEIRELAEWLQVPVVSFRSGKGLVSDEHALGFNCAQGSRYWPQTDLLIAIGTRMELRWARWVGPDQPTAVKVIRLEIDPQEMDRHPVDVPIIADAKESVKALLEAVREDVRQSVSREAEFSAIKQAVQIEIEKNVQPQLSYLQVIRDVLPRDGFFVEEISQMGFASWFGFPVYQPRTFVTGGYQGTLGFGFPTALGVKVANPDKAVVSVVGDGGFMFGVQELATAVQYGINLVTIVFNNSAFENVRRDQQRFYGGRLQGSVLQNPDFVRLAESFGVTGYRIDSPIGLRSVLDKALQQDQPALIEVEIKTGSEGSPWKYLMPGTAYGG
ncbi:MAG: hypothetical protein K9K86_08705 [Pseudomonadales bacterium]|nr:hypothetical protein [Pseudomonadales bacterium]